MLAISFMDPEEVDHGGDLVNVVPDDHPIELADGSRRPVVSPHFADGEQSRRLRRLGLGIELFSRQ